MIFTKSATCRGYRFHRYLRAAPGGRRARDIANPRSFTFHERYPTNVQLDDARVGMNEAMSEQSRLFDAAAMASAAGA